MARTIAEIQAEMDAKQATETSLSGLNSPSQSAIYTLWKYITSYAIFVHETFWDLFKTELETIVDNAPIGTNQWVRDQVFKFQYSATNPQVVQLVDFVPSYDPVDETLQIITRCSSTTLPSRLVSIKVAKNEPPEALATAELNSLKGYLKEVGFAGVEYSVSSNAPDKLYLDATIYYDGQYASVIQTNVIAAIDNYLATLPFDGIVYVSKLEDAIQSVTGVKDIVINNLAIRADSVSFSNKSYLVLNTGIVQRNSTLFAGYVVGETTTGETFTDKLTFTVQ